MKERARKRENDRHTVGQADKQTNGANSKSGWKTRTNKNKLLFDRNQNKPE